MATYTVTAPYDPQTGIIEIRVKGQSIHKDGYLVAVRNPEIQTMAAMLDFCQQTADEGEANRIAQTQPLA